MIQIKSQIFQFRFKLRNTLLDNEPEVIFIHLQCTQCHLPGKI